MRTGRPPETHRNERPNRKREKFIHALEDLTPSDFTHEEWSRIMATISNKQHGYRTPNLPEV